MKVVLDRSSFQKILNVATLGEMQDAVQLYFTPEELRVCVKNAENTLGTISIFTPEYFGAYEVEKEMKIAFSIGIKKSAFKNILGMMDMIELTTDGSSLIFNDGKFVAPLKEYDEKLEFPWLKPIRTEFGYLLGRDESMLENYNYTRVTLPKQLNILKVENLRFKISNGVLSVSQQDDLGYRVNLDISSIVEKHVEDVSVLVDATLIDYAIKIVGNDCYIALGKAEGQPLLVQFFTGDSTHSICVAVAPKLDEE